MQLSMNAFFITALCLFSVIGIVESSKHASGKLRENEERFYSSLPGLKELQDAFCQTLTDAWEFGDFFRAGFTQTGD